MTGGALPYAERVHDNQSILAAKGSTRSTSHHRLPAKRLVRLAEIADLSGFGVTFALVSGVLLFSPFGWSLMLNIGGNFYPEPAIAILLFMCLIFNNSTSTALRLSLISSSFGTWVVLSLLLAAIGICMHGSIIDAYSDLRCVILLGAGYCITGKGRRQISVPGYKLLFSICTVSIVANMIAFFVLPDANNYSAKYQYPVAGVFFLVGMIALLNRQVLPLVIMFLVAIFMAITGFYRQYYGYAILILIIFLSTFFQNIIARQVTSVTTRIGMYCVMMISILVLYYFGESLYDYGYAYITSDDSRYAQTIAKFDALVDYFQTGRFGTGDDLRAAYVPFIWDNILSFSLPGGLGQKTLIDNWGSYWMDPATRLGILGSSSKDGGHLFLAAHYGILLSGALIAKLMHRCFVNIRAVRGFYEAFVYLNLLILGAVYFMTMGMMFNQTAAAFTFGAFIGLMTNPPRLSDWALRTEQKTASVAD